MPKSNAGKSFEAFGHTFEPKRNFRKTETVESIFSKVKMIGINNRNGGKWNYKTFYKLADKALCGEFDIYIMDSKTQVVPGKNELYEYACK